MTHAFASNLVHLVQTRAFRLQQSLTEHLNVHVTSSHVETTFDRVVLASSSCSFRSLFVQSRHHKLQVASEPSKVSVDTNVNGHLQVLAINEVVLLILSFLDGESLSRVQGATSAYHTFIQHYHELLYRSFIEEKQVFHTVITSSSFFKSYLLSFRHELDQELAHTHAVHPTHKALEQFCSSTEQHGFVAMFCDTVEFHDPRIARFVAWKRQSALSMVLAATPDHVMNFRKQSSYIGPITFVPVDNPLWPVFTSSMVDTPEFMGYAFDHATMVEGYEALKDTVVKSILKELMIFDTTENSAAYRRRIGRPLYAIILEDEEAQEQIGLTERTSHLSFSSHLRRQLAKYPIAERICRLQSKIKAVDDRIAAIPNSADTPSD